MSNIKWGITAGILALFISVILGMISGVSAFYIFLRALIFTFVFFGIGFGLRMMINNFFPDLLLPDDESSGQEDEQAGSRINITLDSMGEYAVPELFMTQSSANELGNIEDLISGKFRPERQQKTNGAGIDRKREASYNDFEAPKDAEDSSSGISSNDGFSGYKEEAAQASYQGFTASFGDEMGLGGLPDLDTMAMAFSPTAVGSPPSQKADGAGIAAGMDSTMDFMSSASPVFEFEEPQARNSGNKPQALQGDWDAKGLAEGIRTVLSKEQ